MARKKPRTTWPRWISTKDEVLLREVAPGLFVGGCKAVRALQGRPWAAVIDVYGSSGTQAQARYYTPERVEVLLHWTMYDGATFPPGLLDAAATVVAANIARGPVLIHCQAGLSRSASVAYAILRVLGGLSESEARRRVYVEDGWPEPVTIASADLWASGNKRPRFKKIRLLRV